MEPITLCGLMIVAVGLWAHYEPLLKAVTRSICNNMMLKVLSALFVKAVKPACANRYVPYPQ